MKSAQSSVILYDLMSELGIDTPRRYISDDISSWYIQVDFGDTYCVDKVLSIKGIANTHSWECSDDGCGMAPCKGSRCNDLEVSVLNLDLQEDLPANCGNAVRISIPQTDGKLLDFDYFGISEIAVTGQLYVGPTPTSMYQDDPDALSCTELGSFYFLFISIEVIWYELKLHNFSLKFNLRLFKV